MCVKCVYWFSQGYLCVRIDCKAESLHNSTRTSVSCIQKDKFILGVIIRVFYLLVTSFVCDEISGLQTIVSLYINEVFTRASIA